MHLAQTVRSVVLATVMLALAGCSVPGTESAGDAQDRQAAEQLRRDAKTYEAQREQEADAAAVAAQREADAVAADDTPTAAPDDVPAASSADDAAQSTVRTSAVEATASRGASRGSLLTAAARRSFGRLAAQLPGAEGIAVARIGSGQTVYKAGSLAGGVAWSTSKVPLAMAAISAGTARESDLRAALTRSDNAAAERLWAGLGAGNAAASAATAQLRAAGDTRTQVQANRLRAGYTAFGQTNWMLTDQVRFAGGLHCTAAGKRVRQFMGQVTAAQRWGLGTLASAMFKGGWGPGRAPGSGNGWLERQFGIVTIGGQRIAIAIASTAPDHGSATQSLTRIAAWARDNVAVSGSSGSGRCR